LARLLLFMKNVTRMAQDFSHVIFEHCPREANEAAHQLASYTRRAPTSVWFDTPPECLVQILLDDVALLITS
jgi:hypothetical protein